MCDGMALVSYVDFGVVAGGRRGGPIAGSLGCLKFGLDKCRHVADDYVSLATVRGIPECALAEFGDRLTDGYVGEVVACTESEVVDVFAGIVDYYFLRLEQSSKAMRPIDVFVSGRINSGPKLEQSLKKRWGIHLILGNSLTDFKL